MNWLVSAAMYVLMGISPSRQIDHIQKIRVILDAIRQVETGHCKDPSAAVGDNGLAIGPYQIHERYWRDSKVAGQYEDCRNQEYAEQVMLAYWLRYEPGAFRHANAEVLARAHNGGCGWRRNPKATNGYWSKVSRIIASKKTK